MHQTHFLRMESDSVCQWEITGSCAQSRAGVSTGVYLTNTFHFSVRLYCANAQMTSKHGKNKEVRYEPQASSVTNVLTMF